jgi:cell division protein FtsW (lipid II flippase)
MLPLVAIYALIGGGLKYIDDTFDEGLHSRRVASAIAAVLVVLWIALSATDAYSATILTAVLLGVLFSGKIDNRIFTASTALIVLTILFFARENLLLLPLAVLTIFGIIDEKGNDYVDANRAHRVVEFFFAHRFALKLALLAICVASLIPFAYFVAFLCFDAAYDTVGYLGRIELRRIMIKWLPTLKSLYRIIVFG